MMGISALERGGITLRPHLDGALLRLEFSGCADDEAQTLLPGYFKLLHAEVERLDIQSVVIDVRRLTFINSSCFKALVTWVDLLNAMDASARYRIRFLIDPSLHWQSRSFDALHRMCLEQVSIEVGSGGER